MRAGGVFGKDSVSILEARRSRVSVWDALGMLAMGGSAQGIQALHLTEALQGGAYCIFAERIARVGRLTKSARVTQGDYAGGGGPRRCGTVGSTRHVRRSAQQGSGVSSLCKSRYLVRVELAGCA